MNLAQFYTDSAISDHLVSEFCESDPASIIDIGCGELGLLRAARNRWRNAQLIGYDIDPIHATRESEENILVDLGDGLDPDLSRRIEDIHGKIDLAISNPPYISVDRTSKNQEILNRANLLECVSKTQKLLPAELIFLAQNLLVTKENSELGVILPSGFISGERWKPLRELLISEYVATCCIELPPKAFSKAEVSTYALFIKKSKKNSDKHRDVILKTLSDSHSIKIAPSDAANRLDYTYYSARRSTSQSQLTSQKIIEIYRGNKSHAELTKKNIAHIHTTSLKDDLQIVRGHHNAIEHGIRYASAGDILISRVGTRCLGRAAYLRTGRIAISDCIIAVKASLGEELWNAISRDNFRSHISKIALGAGAKYITKSILEEVFNGR